MTIPHKPDILVASVRPQNMIEISPYRKTILWFSLILYGLFVCGGVIMETWKAVVRYEGIYKVSDQGRVRRIKAANGATVGRILRSSKDKDGYCLVHLCREGICKTNKVSRLVLTAFVGSPKPEQESNHKDGVKANNRPENLEWVTKSENNLHKCRVLGKSRGELHNKAKLTNKDLPVIRRLLAEGKLLQREIGELFGVSGATISDIKLGRYWAHI